VAALSVRLRRPPGASLLIRSVMPTPGERLRCRGENRVTSVTQPNSWAGLLVGGAIAGAIPGLLLTSGWRTGSLAPHGPDHITFLLIFWAIVLAAVAGVVAGVALTIWKSSRRDGLRMLAVTVPALATFLGVLLTRALV